MEVYQEMTLDYRCQSFMRSFHSDFLPNSYSTGAQYISGENFKSWSHPAPISIGVFIVDFSGSKFRPTLSASENDYLLDYDATLIPDPH